MFRFHFSRYWGMWSRRIGTINGMIVELNLTTMYCSPDSCEHNKQEIFRVHCTDSEPKDRDVNELPQRVIEQMELHYGKELASRLINHDYLSEVSLEDILKAERKSNGGGVPFQFIKDFRDGKAEYWYNK